MLPPIVSCLHTSCTFVCITSVGIRQPVTAQAHPCFSGQKLVKRIKRKCPFTRVVDKRGFRSAGRPEPREKSDTVKRAERGMWKEGVKTCFLARRIFFTQNDGYITQVHYAIFGIARRNYQEIPQI